MWTLIIPLITTLGPQAHVERMEFRTEYASREQCQSARLALAERLEAALRRVPPPASNDAYLEDRAAAWSDFDQPPGVDPQWGYENSSEIGYCVSGSDDPLARARNSTGLS